MNQLATTTTLSVSENRVLDACRAAMAAEADYAQKAVIAGALLLQQRSSMMTSHGGKSYTAVQHWNDKTKPAETQFTVWLQEHGLAQSTAYRWMAAAENVARGVLNIKKAVPFDNAIDVEGIRIPISQALTAPEAELPQEARNFRQAFFDFMADKTLSDAVRGAVDGESPAHRISRAAAGKLKGGHAGEDRKDFPTFIAEKLSDVSTHLKHWKSMTGAQQDAIETAFGRALEKWPSALLASLQKQIKAEISKR